MSEIRIAWCSKGDGTYSTGNWHPMKKYDSLKAGVVLENKKYPELYHWLEEKKNIRLSCISTSFWIPRVWHLGAHSKIDLSPARNRIRIFTWFSCASSGFSNMDGAHAWIQRGRNGIWIRTFHPFWKKECNSKITSCIHHIMRIIKNSSTRDFLKQLFFWEYLIFKRYVYN